MALSPAWKVAIISGSIVNLAMFMILPALAQKEEPIPPAVVTVEFSEWQPAKKIDPPNKPQQKKSKPRPIPKPVKDKPLVKKNKPVLPKTEPQKIPVAAKPPVSEPVLSEAASPPEKTTSTALPITSHSDENAIPEPVPVFQLSRLPRYIHQVKPDYPASMRAIGREVSFKIKVLIDANGRVRKVYVDSTIEPAFSLAVKKAIFQSTFQAGEKNGKKVPVLYNIPINFRLN